MSITKFDPKVGDLVTVCGWSDRYVYEVIARTEKTMSIRRMKATLVNKEELTFSPGGFCGHVSGEQKYSFESAPEAPVKKATLRKSGGWYVAGSKMRVIEGAHEHYDYNF